jgi:dihydrofolate reductase
MRKVKYTVASSLDNFIAREDGSVDWLIMQGEHMEEFAEYSRAFDTVLMGRKTYEMAVSHGMTAYPGMQNYVFSRTLKESPDTRVTIISKNASEFVTELKNENGRDIMLVGGGELAASLLSENLIDEIVLNVHPVLLGSGIPLFAEVNRQIDLELIGKKIYKNGLIMPFYRVKK